ncbi:MAG: heme exporter protein CcmD [Granulosicoccus sp.]|nr:heme exporter protein CcmD [Granulosicoccus sp.]
MAELLEWLKMGGHGGYIWSAYAITFVVLLANLFFARWQFSQRLLQALRQKRKVERS